MEKRIFDCNVWNWVGHETDYAFEGWRIDVYECYDDVDFEHHDMPEKIIYLNTTQARMLTLGLDEWGGGDYSSDSDFWIDPKGFLNTYKNIPRKVTRYLEALV